MRVRSAVLFSAVALLAVACGFGVDLDNLFDGTPPTDSGGSDGATEASGDATAPAEDATIPKVKVVSLQAGDDFACALRVDGTVMCWGYNDSAGQLGNGGPLSSSAPVLVKDLKDAKSLAVGQDHTCIVHSSGGVSCWGDNGSRQLGDGTTNKSPTPVNVLQLTNAVAVSAGSSFSCALLQDGTVSCWGDDTSGQLGDNTQTTRSQPAPVMGVSNVTQLASAGATTCALVKSGDVYCWGKNDQGQAGSASPPNVLTAQKVAGLPSIAAIGSGAFANHFCAVNASGGVQCWGEGDNGQLGNGSTNGGGTPVDVTAISDAVGVSAGGGFTCSWEKSGSVNCWGTNSWRQLGVGDTSPPNGASTPLPVGGIANAASVGAGDSFACAVMSAGNDVSCWGSNYSGSLGRATHVNSALPLAVMTQGASSAIATGRSHACAVASGGAMSCWGFNTTRQLGSNTTLGSGAPIAVTGLAGVKAAAAGNQHTCALLGSNQIQCWGESDYGELGNAMTPYVEFPPVQFGSLSNASAVGAGNNFTCALLSSGQIACSGTDQNNVLGNPNGQQSSPVAVLAAPFDAGPDASPEAGAAAPYTSVSKIAIGGGHSCLVHGTTVACWGATYNGECGTTNNPQTYPLDISLPQGATDVAAGGGHTCVVLADGSVSCFGANDHGQLGGGGNNGPMLRTPSLGGKKASAVAAGDSHTCALITDGTVLCWGSGAVGEIGNGVYSDTPTPSPVTGLTGVTAIRANEHFTCALKMDGSVSCWGNNQSGQLGDGTPISTGTPAPVAGY